MTIKILVFLLTLFLIPTPPFSVATEQMIIISKEQQNKKIEVNTGDVVQIQLPETGSAGYSWHIEELDSKYLKLICEETKDVSGEGKIGAPVRHIWRFRAEKEGLTEIKMDYYRSWEGIEKATDHFVIRIKILKNEVQP